MLSLFSGPWISVCPSGGDESLENSCHVSYLRWWNKKTTQWWFKKNKIVCVVLSWDWNITVEGFRRFTRLVEFLHVVFQWSRRFTMFYAGGQNASSTFFFTGYYRYYRRQRKFKDIQVSRLKFNIFSQPFKLNFGAEQIDKYIHT